MELTGVERRGTTLDSFIRAAAVVAEVDPASVIGPGTVLEGCYVVGERLGSGGMATVYRARDQRLSREVAIKVPRLAGRERARVFAMFEREARATARLEHPNIVALHHIGEHAGMPYAVLGLLRGETLAARLARRGPLALPAALEILGGVLRALAHAHDRGIVHRDLKPQNVFLTEDEGAGEGVKLLDFGVAVEPARSPGTSTRAAGTPGYMAPEHREAADPRNDLWAAGVLLLECVTGRRPEAGAPLPPLPRDVRAVIARAIAADRTERPASAEEMRRALEEARVPGRPPPAGGVARARPRRRARVRRAWAVLACAVLACGGGGALAWRALGDGGAAGGLVVPRDGRWRGDPAAGTPWETQLQRIDETRFAYTNRNRLTGRGHAGTLVLERLSDGTTLLSGKWADLPTCPTCTNVGFIEFIVLDATHLYQNRGAWGPSHDDYQEWWPVYRYKWEGTVSSLAAP